MKPAKPISGPQQSPSDHMINRIDATVDVDELADFPFPDQPDVDFFATSYSERGKSYYSICVAVTKLGMMQRAWTSSRSMEASLISTPSNTLARPSAVASSDLLRDSVEDTGNDFDIALRNFLDGTDAAIYLSN